MIYEEIEPVVLSYLKFQLFKNHKWRQVILEKIDTNKVGYSIVNLLTDVKQISSDLIEREIGGLPINFIFEHLAKSLVDQDNLLAQATLVKLFGDAAKAASFNVSISELFTITTEIIVEKAEHNQATVEEMCKRVVLLKTHQRMALYNIINKFFVEFDESKKAIAEVMKILFSKQDFAELIGAAKYFSRHLAGEQSFEPSFFRKPMQTHLLQRTFEQPIIGVLPDGRKIQYLDKKKAVADGNCGFRAILGGKGLGSMAGKYLTRQGIIELFNSSLKDKVVIKLIAKDLIAKYQEYVANVLNESDFAKLPKKIQEVFVEFKAKSMAIGEKFSKLAKEKLSENTETIVDFDRIAKISGLEANEKELMKCCKNEEIIILYLNEYLVNDDNWPHLQGSMAAFGYLCGIKIHCFQKQKVKGENGSFQLKYIDVNHPMADYSNGEAFIIQSDAFDHFDELDYKLIDSNEMDEIKTQNVSMKKN